MELSSLTTATVKVDYITEAGTAGTSDYYGRSGMLEFKPLEKTKTITVTTKEDTIDELTEKLKLKLSNAVNGKIVDSEGVGTIADNDPTPVLTVTSRNLALGTTGIVTEGDSGYFRVSLDRSSSRDITVNYATATGTASTDDFTDTSGKLTFSPGQTIKDVRVYTTEDNIDELNETFKLALSNPGNANLHLTYKEAAFTISDDDPLPTISIVGDSGLEGDLISGDPLTFKVSLSHPSSRQITVDYATASDTATAGKDFISRSEKLTFAPGATSQSFSVSLLADGLDEGASESFVVNLSNPSNNATIPAGSGVGVGTITDDDKTPTAVAIVGPASAYGPASVASSQAINLRLILSSGGRPGQDTRGRTASRGAGGAGQGMVRWPGKSGVNHVLEPDDGDIEFQYSGGFTPTQWTSSRSFGVLGFTVTTLNCTPAFF